MITTSVGGTIRHFGLFNLVPPFGSAGAIGASPGGVPIVFDVDLRESDSGLDLSAQALPSSFDLESMQLSLWGTPWLTSHDA